LADCGIKLAGKTNKIPVKNNQLFFDPLMLVLFFTAFFLLSCSHKTAPASTSTSFVSSTPSVHNSPPSSSGHSGWYHFTGPTTKNIVYVEDNSPGSSPVRTARHRSTNVAAGSFEMNILRYVNDYRRKKRLPALEMDGKISSEAEKHSRDMATRRVPFGHAGFNKRSRDLTKGLHGNWAIAENVALGNMSAYEVVQGWIRSAPHRRNMEGRFNFTGIGTAKGRDGQIYFTEIFLKK
jgi:uncharacterized protein YkwD